MESSSRRKPMMSQHKVSQEPTSEPTADENARPPKRRLATVYDAVAGKVSSTSRLRSDDASELQRTTAASIKHSTRDTTLAPDEVLFRRADAPQRYFEHDLYSAHERDLPRGGQGVLPESDLLKAIHGYASRFYAASADNNNASSNAGGVDERSMDETALLALGILLEEAGSEVLGRRGDLVFSEGVADDDDDEDDPDGDHGGDEVARADCRIVGHQDVGLKRRGPSKRRRTRQASAEGE